jgi:hypothetical protein
MHFLSKRGSKMDREKKTERGISYRFLWVSSKFDREAVADKLDTSDQFHFLLLTD